MSLSDMGNINRSLEVLEMKNGEKKLEVPSERPWGAAPLRAPQDSLYLTGSSQPLQPECLKTEYVHQTSGARCL